MTKGGNWYTSTVLHAKNDELHENFSKLQKNLFLDTEYRSKTSTIFLAYYYVRNGFIMLISFLRPFTSLLYSRETRHGIL